MPPSNDKRLPRGLLEQPRTARSRAARRARRRRAIAALLALVALAAAAVLLVTRSGMPDRLATMFEDAPRDGERAAESTGAPASATTTAPQSGAGADAASADQTTAVAAPVATPTDLGSRTVTIGWAGDTTPGSKYGNPPNAGRALFEYVRTYTSEPDIMVANLEGTFGTGGPSKCDGRDSSACYAFQAPPTNAAALAWAGIDVVNLANNHSNDYFTAGLKTTRESLSANGVGYTGLNGVIPVKEVDGVKVAFLGFSPYSWSPNIGDLARARALVQQADEAADVVVVLMHAGAEGSDKTRTPKGAETAYGEFRGDSRAFAHAAIDAGADLVLGSGPHVIRGMEQYKGRLVAYSLGNFAGWKNFSRSGNLALSGLLTARVAGDGRVLGGTWLPLRIADPGVPKVDSSDASLSLVRKLSQTDFASPVIPAADGSFTVAPE